jgi:hypothetical protein
MTGFVQPLPFFVGAVGLCGRISGAEPRQAGEVIGQIGHVGSVAKIVGRRE